MREDFQRSETTFRRPALGGTQTCRVRWPNVSVFDPDGHLPLALQRDRLATKTYPFEQQLLDDIVRDYTAFLLVNAPTKPLRRRPQQIWADL